MRQNRNTKLNFLGTARKVLQEESNTKKLNPVDLYYIVASDYRLMLHIICRHKTYSRVGTENSAFDSIFGFIIKRR